MSTRKEQSSRACESASGKLLLTQIRMQFKYIVNIELLNSSDGESVIEPSCRFTKAIAGRVGT